MRKLTKANIDELQKCMPVLDEDTQRLILGGGYEEGARTDCFFKCMEYMYGAYSGKMGVTSDDFAKAYYDKLQIASGNDSERGNGLDPQNASGFLGAFFDFNQTTAGAISETSFKDKHYMGISDDGTHAVIITAYSAPILDEDGNVKKAGFFIYFNPQDNTSGIKSEDSFGDVFDVTGMSIK